MRYAYFPQNRRLAVEWLGVLTVYDTAEYQFRGMAAGPLRRGRGHVDTDSTRARPAQRSGDGKSQHPPSLNN